MFRHFSSLLVSLVLHALLLATLLYSYKEIFSVSKTEQVEEKFCMKLSCLCNEEEVVEKERVAPPKKVTPKVEPKPKPKVKPKIKPKEKPKEIVEQVVLVNNAKEKYKKEEPLEEVLEEKSVEIVAEKVGEKATSPYGSSMQNDKQERSKKTPEQAYMNANIRIIVKLLQENLYYPRSARKRGMQGEVLVKFRLSKEGNVISSEVLSSEHKILSRAALETIESLSGKFPKPKEELLLSVPISYSLKR